MGSGLEARLAETEYTRRPEWNPFAVGIGTNLGDRIGNLRFGISRVAEIAEELRVSSIYETKPVHVDDQPLFLNACCIGRTRLTARQLLSQLGDAERAAGRRRSETRFGPRPLDMDILLFGREPMNESDLVIPHPRLRERAFVLTPLAEIAPDWIVPGSGATAAASVASLAARVGAEGVRWFVSSSNVR